MAGGFLAAGVPEVGAFAAPMSLQEKCERAQEVVVFEVEEIADLLAGVEWRRSGAPFGLFGGTALARCTIVEVIAGRPDSVGEQRFVPAKAVWDPSYDLREGMRYVGFLELKGDIADPVHHSAVAEVDGESTEYQVFENEESRALTLDELRKRVRAQLEEPPPVWSAYQASCGMPYRLYHPGTVAPPIPEAGLPLVVFLHGAGERGDDNKAQLKHVALEFAPPAGPRQKGSDRLIPAIVLAPQCPGGAWWRGEMVERVVALAREWAARPEVDGKRVVFTGLSMGGFGTWEALALAPDLISAAVIVCGGGDPATVGRFAHVPIRVVHGDADEVVLPERSREMVSALEEAGGNVQYIELPGVGHDSWTWAFREGRSALWLLNPNRDQMPTLVPAPLVPQQTE